jgi:8-oxo-dGTP pyrophosphatase MutT (NUDIX family)
VTDALRARLAANLAAFERVPADRPDLRQASVAVCVLPGPVVAGTALAGTALASTALASTAVASTVIGDTVLVGTGETLLITRRARGLRQHAGQWALPGGRRDAGESAEDAALRELHEETSVDLPATAVLGVLDDYVTRSGYVITPVVVWGGGAADRTADLRGAPGEVARIFQVPIADLDVEPELLRVRESDALVIRLPLLGGHVHAPTAAIIYQFCQAGLHGRPARVAHLDAPARLWR